VSYTGVGVERFRHRSACRRSRTRCQAGSASSPSASPRSVAAPDDGVAHRANTRARPLRRRASRLRANLRFRSDSTSAGSSTSKRTMRPRGASSWCETRTFWPLLPAKIVGRVAVGEQRNDTLSVTRNRARTRGCWDPCQRSVNDQPVAAVAHERAKVPIRMIAFRTRAGRMPAEYRRDGNRPCVVVSSCIASDEAGSA